MARWAESRVKSTKHILNLEYHKRNSTLIQQLRQNDGTILRHAKDALNTLEAFYGSLYSSGDHRSDVFFNYLQLDRNLDDEHFVMVLFLRKM